MRYFFVFLVCFISTNTFGQNKDSLRSKSSDRYSFKRIRKTEVLTGMSWQADWRNKENSQTRHYLEVGIARSVHAYSRHGIASFGFYASEEMHFGKTNIYGTKLGIYTHYLLDLGLAMVYYTDFNKGNLKLRPEMGIGAGGFRAVFGCNIGTINNKAWDALRHHRAQVSVQFMIPVRKKEIETDHTKQLGK